MSGNEKRPLVPRLRFPEFREAWASSPMSELYSFKCNNSLSRDKLNYAGGSFRNIHYGDIHTKFALHFRADTEPVPYINDGESHSAVRPENYSIAGDVVFADASEDMKDIGKAIEIIDTGDLPLVSGLHTIHARPKLGAFALGFGAYLFSSEGIRTQIQHEAQGAKVLGLSASRLANVQLYYPSQLNEQQKIVDCLSSLDDLITLESKKLNALKLHKKGLMQRLFPTEGKTVPRLRFPGFQREAWNEVTLGDLGTFTGGGTPSTQRKDYWSGKNPWVSSSDISDESIFYINITRYVSDEAITNSATKVVPENSVLIVSRVGIGKIAVTKVPLCTSQDFTNLTPTYDDPLFLALYLKTLVNVFLSMNQGMAIKGFTKNDISNLAISIPSIPEQRRIAECLSSLDDLITAETQKLIVLKAHKKGLMQQLFPVLEDTMA